MCVCDVVSVFLGVWEWVGGSGVFVCLFVSKYVCDIVCVLCVCVLFVCVCVCAFVFVFGMGVCGWVGVGVYVGVYVHANQCPWVVHPTCPLKRGVALFYVFLHS